MKINRVDHIHIYSADPDSSVRFYTEVFEAETVGAIENSYRRTMHILRLGGLALVVAPYPPGITPGIPAPYVDGTYQHGYGLAHFGLHVDDLSAVVTTVRQRGARILSEPREYSGLRFAYVGGPDGVIVELLEHHGEWITLLGPARSASGQT